MAYPYWLPPPLALPPRAETLRWTSRNTDRGAAWFWAKSLHLRALLDPNGDPYTLSEQAWGMFRAIRLDNLRYGLGDKHRRWLDAYVVPKRRPSKGRSWVATREQDAHILAYVHARFGYADLPTRLYGDRFAIVHLACFERNGWAGTEDESCHSFLVARREGDRWRVYPRSLLSTRWDVTVAKVLTARQIEGLAKRWDKAFDALPRWAVDRDEVEQGAPYIAGSLPTRDADHRYHSRSDRHPYWEHATTAIAAVLGLVGIVFPPPTRTFHNAYHSTLLTDNIYPRDAGEKGRSMEVACPAGLVRVELPYGWHTYNHEEAPVPNGEDRARLGVAQSALLEVLNRFAPDIPFFFDTLDVRDSSGSSFQDMAYAKHDPMYGTGQHFLWIDESSLRLGSAHATLDALARLPPAWAAALRDAVQTRLPAALAA